MIMADIIARNLCLSNMMPNTDITIDAGIPNNISNPPRAATGLPQPGLHLMSTAYATTAIPKRAADIFP
jgi:hypothetical protein